MQRKVEQQIDVPPFFSLKSINKKSNNNKEHTQGAGKTEKQHVQKEVTPKINPSIKGGEGGEEERNTPSSPVFLPYQHLLETKSSQFPFRISSKQREICFP